MRGLFPTMRGAKRGDGTLPVYRNRDVHEKHPPSPGCDYSSLEAITSTRGFMWAVSPLIWHVCVVRGERGPHAYRR